MQNTSGNKQEIGHAEMSLLSISRLQNRCQTTTYNPKEGGPELQPFRTTTCLNNGFTLIELLVVVLIIGILAAVAVPQYQKAVEKAKAMQGITLLKAVYQAQIDYHLANGTFADKLDKLAIDIPWTGTTKWEQNGVYTDTRSNEDWSLQITAQNPQYTGPHIQIGRISGPYKGAGFIMYFNPTHGNLKGHTLFCGEYGAEDKEGNRFQKKRGDFCIKVMGVKNTTSYDGTVRAWEL